MRANMRTSLAVLGAILVACLGAFGILILVIVMGWIQ